MVPLLILVEIIGLFLFRQILIFLYGCGILVTETCIMQIKGVCWTNESFPLDLWLHIPSLPGQVYLTHTTPVCIIDKSVALVVIDIMGSSVLRQAGSTLGEEGTWRRLQSARLC